MAAWYDKPSSRIPGTEVFEAVSLSDQRLKDLADWLGVQIVQDKEGHYLSLPPNVDVDDPKWSANFLGYWMEEASTHHSSRMEQDRIRRIQTYRQMDTVMAEASIALDTYADEALGVGFVEDPIEIAISDASIKKEILKLFETNEILKRARSILRNLIKYGDVGHKINLPPPKDEKDFQDIELEYVDPIAWECRQAKDSTKVIGYRVGPIVENGRRSPPVHGGKEGVIQLWGFNQMTVFDEDFKPYGKSLLEPMRIDFDHLMTMEALLALARAARIERLVIKVPCGTDNPVQAAQKLQHVKANFKNTIFKDTSLGTKTYSRTPALTDVLVIPSDAGFDVSKLPTGVDLNSVEDVKYFRDRAFMVTGLPKTYFLHDEARALGSALAQQDVMFARKLVSFQTAFIEGLVKLITILCVYINKARISNLKVEVRLKKPAQLSTQLVEYYSLLADTAMKMINAWKELTGVQEVPEPMFRSLLVSLGMPDQVAATFTVAKVVTPDDVRQYIAASGPSMVRSNRDLGLFFERDVLLPIEESFKAATDGKPKLRVVE